MMGARNYVLVLEDEPIIGFTLEDMLAELGFGRVELFTSIEDACASILADTPDLAVLDVNIHGKRSYSVAALLRERNVPFVFATGYGDAEHPEDLRAVPTVTKPYRLNDIRTALNAAAK